MKNPLRLKIVTFVMFVVSYLWGNFALLNFAHTDLLVFLALCCFSSLLFFVYSLTLTKGY